MFNSTTFSSRRRRVQRANPSGAGEQARAISFASAAPSNIRGRAELGLYLRLSVASKPSSTTCWTRASDIVDAGVQRSRDGAVAPPFARVRYVSFQQNARSRQYLRR